MVCAACGYAADALGHTTNSPADHSGPSAGDYSICFSCGEVSVIELHPLLGAQLRKATVAELAEFSRDPANIEAVRRLHRFNHDRRGMKP
jgi:hypothetical protein